MKKLRDPKKKICPPLQKKKERKKGSAFLKYLICHIARLLLVWVVAIFRYLGDRRGNNKQETEKLRKAIYRTTLVTQERKKKGRCRRFNLQKEQPVFMLKRLNAKKKNAPVKKS